MVGRAHLSAADCICSSRGVLCATKRHSVVTATAACCGIATDPVLGAFSAVLSGLDWCARVATCLQCNGARTQQVAMLPNMYLSSCADHTSRHRFMSENVALQTTHRAGSCIW